jgi:glycerol-3-phosphate acyltransferase PlsY
LIGAIPNGYIISKKFYGIDITKYGSGNIGTANVQRVIGTKTAILVFILDFSKGIIAILLGRYILHSEVYTMICGIFAVIGHDYSVFMPHFKGGKGVATTYGVAALINPPAAILSALTYWIVVSITKYSSLGSIISVSLYPLFLFLINRNKDVVIWSIIFAALVVYSHRKNIKRLLNGTERKIGEKVEVKKE